MILGLSTAAFTGLHVAISLIGIATGFLVIFGMIRGLRLNGLTVIFLATTILTSVTGFFFPIKQLTPGLILGGLSLAILAITLLARYAFNLRGGWRTAYVVTAVVAQYFNVFVLVVQSFENVPALHALAPTGKEAPFAITQLVVLVLFAALGWKSVKGFGGESVTRRAVAA